MKGLPAINTEFSEAFKAEKITKIAYTIQKLMSDVQFAMQTVVINANRKFSHQNSGNVSIYSQKRLRKFGRGPGEAKEATSLCAGSEKKENSAVVALQ